MCGLHLHNNDFHTENLIFSAGFVCHIGKLVDLGRIHLLEEDGRALEQLTHNVVEEKGQGNKDKDTHTKAHKELQPSLKPGIWIIPVWSNPSHLDFSSDEETGDTDELQR